MLTHDASVAAWAATVARAQGPGGTRLWMEPLVVQVTAAEAQRLLRAGVSELAVVAAWAVHDQRGARAQAVVQEAVGVLAAEPDAALREAMMRAMLGMLDKPLVTYVREAMMQTKAFPETSAWRELREEIEAIGEERGEAKALLAVLEARGLAVSEAQREAVLSCSDRAQVRQWLVRAATAVSADQVFSAPV